MSPEEKLDNRIFNMHYEAEEELRELIYESSFEKELWEVKNGLRLKFW